MDMNTSGKRDYSLINCISGAILAYIATIPVHELYHLITHTLYGGSIRAFYATAVDNIELDLQALSPFHRIMEAGGSASILNAVAGLILVFLLPRLKNISGMLRVFLIQYTGMQLCEGFGYFLIGGFGIGDCIVCERLCVYLFMRHTEVAACRIKRVERLLEFSHFILLVVFSRIPIDFV